MAHARKTDPVTSHAAAASITAIDDLTSKETVLWVLRLFGPMTDKSMIATIRAFQPSRQFADSRLRTARSDLVKLGKVEKLDIVRPGCRIETRWDAVEAEQ